MNACECLWQYREQVINLTNSLVTARGTVIYAQSRFDLFRDDPVFFFVLRSEQVEYERGVAGRLNRPLVSQARLLEFKRTVVSARKMTEPLPACVLTRLGPDDLPLFKIDFAVGSRR